MAVSALRKINGPTFHIIVGFENAIKLPDQVEIQKTLLGKSFHYTLILNHCHCSHKLYSAAAPSIEPVITQRTKQSAKAPAPSISEVSYPQAQGKAHTCVY